MKTTNLSLKLPLVIIFVVALSSAFAVAQTPAEKLRSGPMVGYSEMREVMLWVQTTVPAEVAVRYWSVDEPTEKFTTPPASTTHGDALTAKLRADKVLPANAYKYELLIGGEAVPLQRDLSFSTLAYFQERMPPPDFSFVAGGAHYVAEEGFELPYIVMGEEYGVFDVIEGKSPDFMLWVGNTAHLREPDWGSRTGYRARYSHARAHPQLQDLLGSTHHYGIWSERDFGPVGAAGSLWNAETARETWDLFWPNPSTGIAGMDNVATFFRWNDCEFFLLDDRSHRSYPNAIASQNTVFGEEQLEWLVRRLEKSTATFKIIVSGSPILSPVENPGNAMFAASERSQFFKELKDRRVDGIFFIAGGRPFGEVTKFVRAGAYDFHEITVGPMTGKPAKANNELNYLRIPGSNTLDRHFAHFRVFGPENGRKLTFSLRTTDDKEIFTETITEQSTSF